MLDCFFHYVISYSFLRCLSKDNRDAAKPPKKIGQEKITIKKKEKKKRKKKVPEEITKFWSSQNLKQFPALPQTSLLTLIKSHSSINFFIPCLLSIPFHRALSLLLIQSCHHYFLQTGYLMQWCPAHRCHKKPKKESRHTGLEIPSTFLVRQLHRSLHQNGKVWHLQANPAN